jgi:site-specific recombinase XerC
MYSQHASQEALDINVNDIHLEGMWVKVKGKAKGTDTSIWREGKHAIEIISNRKRKGNDRKNALFCERIGASFLRGLLKIMKKHQQKAHLFKDLP